MWISPWSLISESSLNLHWSPNLIQNIKIDLCREMHLSCCYQDINAPNYIKEPSYHLETCWRCHGMMKYPHTKLQFHLQHWKSTFPWKCRSKKISCSGYWLVPVQNLTLEMDSSSSPGSDGILHLIFWIKTTPWRPLWKIGSRHGHGIKNWKI